VLRFRKSNPPVDDVVEGYYLGASNSKRFISCSIGFFSSFFFVLLCFFLSSSDEESDSLEETSFFVAFLFFFFSVEPEAGAVGFFSSSGFGAPHFC
jgi:hypothetical protein